MMRQITTPARSFILLVVLALVVAACGDDDLVGDVAQDGDGPFGNGVVTDDGGDLGDLGGVTPGVGNIPGLSDACQAYVNLSFAMTGAFSGNFSGIDDSIISDLPPGAQADGAIIVDALRRFSDGLQAAGIDLSDPTNFATLTPAQMEEFQALGDTVFTDEVDAAFDRLDDSISADCEVAPSP